MKNQVKFQENKYDLNTASNHDTSNVIASNLDYNSQPETDKKKKPIPLGNLNYDYPQSGNEVDVGKKKKKRGELKVS